MAQAYHTKPLEHHSSILKLEAHGHTARKIFLPLPHPMSFVLVTILCVSIFVTRLLPVDIFQITITDDGGTGASLAYSFKS